ncbi:MAG: SPFH domain-containing protein [Planctomycetota bacterium]|jgi:regulator of protease activity HflC (stomatin/prohibitin superfamily)
MTISSKRAENIAWISLLVSVIFFVISLLLGRWSGFHTVYSVSWVILGAALLWFALAIQFHQRALAEQEKLDMGQLSSGDQANAIFQAKGEQDKLFAVAQRRLTLLEKWFVPIFAGLIALYEIGIGLYLFYTIPGEDEVLWKEPRVRLICAVAMVAIAFVGFLLSRYATGMSKKSQWKPLRAGGSLLLGASILCFAIAISLGLAFFGIFKIINIVQWLIPILLVILGTEKALNVIFDIYRPRLKGQYSRAAFDSRLLGIINEPGEILHTAAGAIDYQFGFKVSETWFYKLLGQTFIPLLLFAIIILYLMSTIVVVGPNEQAVIENFGNPLDNQGNVQIKEPGMTLKWPWPFGIAYKYPTEKVMELAIGYVPNIDPETGELKREPLIWGQPHYEEEYPVLVASGAITQNLGEGAMPVSIVNANIPVHYKVQNLYAFLYNHENSSQMLETICYRELAKFCASARLDIDTEADMANSLFGAGREQAKQVLTKNIQQKADEASLGVEIVFVGLQGIHPPVTVSKNYQEVIGAIQQKQAVILLAEALSNRTLSNLVGSVEEANKLYDLAQRYQKARENNNDQETESIRREVDNAFMMTKGEVFQALRKAQAYAYEKASLSEATGKRFDGQLKAYRAAPEIFKQEQLLSVYEEAYENIRKYVIASDPENKQNFIIDLQEKLTPDLYGDITGIEEPN